MRGTQVLIRLAELARLHLPMSGEIAEALQEVIASGIFVLGPRVEEFEQAFATYCGASFGIGVNSGTSALYLALLAAGVGPGDEVITSAFTFVATAAAIAHTGARPVFSDICGDSFTIDPADVAQRITPRTRAIVPVHLYGHPADMDAVAATARQHNIAVIEDAAQAHGAEYKGRRTGVLGDAACFSFYPSKNLGACGEAGMIVTSRADWAERIRWLRDWGEGGETAGCGNYRMGAFQGAVLAIKLRSLERWNAARQDVAHRYCRSITGRALQAPRTAEWAKHVFHIFAVRARSRDLVQAAFAARGIETRAHYPVPLHLMDRFAWLGYGAGDFPAAERAARETLSIPVHPALTGSEIEEVCEALRSVDRQS